MKRSEYNRLYAMSMFFLVNCVVVTSCAQTYYLSFDSLFPMTWYQKGLESSLYVWQTLIDEVDKNNGHSSFSYDVLLGKLAFAQFCLNRMHQMNEVCVADDVAYFATVVQKIQQLFSVMMTNNKTEDFIACAADILTSMQQKLNIRD